MADGLPNAAARAAGGEATARAVIALLIAVGGGTLVLIATPALAMILGIGSELGFNLLGNALWLTLAIGGALLLRAPLRPALTAPWLAALPVAMLGFALALALVIFAGHTLRLPSPAPALPAFALGTIALIFGAAAEEALMRGFLQPLLVHAWGAAAGVLIAGLGFAAVHAVGGWSHPLSLVNITLAGIWFGLLALRTGGFAAPLLAHAGWNWAEALLFGAYPNPGRDAAGSLLDIDILGPGWLGGSEDGMNSALPTTLILALLIAPLLLRWRRAALASEAPPELAEPRIVLPEFRP